MQAAASFFPNGNPFSGAIGLKIHRWLRKHELKELLPITDRDQLAAVRAGLKNRFQRRRSAFGPLQSAWTA